MIVIFRRLALTFALMLGLSLVTAFPAFAATPVPGIYEIHREFYRDAAWAASLTTIEVERGGQMRVNFTYEKLSQPGAYLVCGTEPSDTSATFSDGQSLGAPIDGYCNSRPNERSCEGVLPCTAIDWTVFPRTPEAGISFHINWGAWGTIDNIVLPEIPSPPLPPERTRELAKHISDILTFFQRHGISGPPLSFQDGGRMGICIAYQYVRFSIPGAPFATAELCDQAIGPRIEERCTEMFAELPEARPVCEFGFRSALGI